MGMEFMIERMLSGSFLATLGQDGIEMFRNPILLALQLYKPDLLAVAMDFTSYSLTSQRNFVKCDYSRKSSLSMIFKKVPKS